MIARLKAEVAALEPELATAHEQLARARADRDELERRVLRLEPRASVAQRGGLPGLVAGIPVGIGLMVSWFELPWGHLPIAAAAPFAASAAFLLRGAWRAGRASGARGPG